MGFLADLTMVQRAGGAAVLVLLLVLLLVKQRQGKAAPAAGAAAEKRAKPTRAPKAKATKVKGDKPKRGRGLGRGKKEELAEIAEPMAESKGAQGRMVPRLPAAGSGEEFAAPVPVESFADADAATAMPPVADDNGMINEPGWPTPGEVWAAPDAGQATETETWAAPDPEDDPLTALTTDEPSEFDMTAGWDADEATPEAEETTEDTAPSWDDAQDDFDWTSGDADEAWSAPDAEEQEEVEETESWTGSGDDAVWSEPDETGSWEASEEAEATPDEAPVAVAVEEREDEPETSAIVWEPVDEVEAREEQPAPAVDELDVTPPIADWTPVEEPVAAEPMELVIPEPEHAAEPVVAQSELDTPADSAPQMPGEESMPPSFADASPVELPVAVAAAMESAPAELPVAVEPEPAPYEIPVAVAPQVIDQAPVGLDEQMAEPVASPEVVEFAPAVFTPVFEEPVAEDEAVATDDLSSAFSPADRWAAMSPGGVTEVADPVASWARLQPIAPAVIVPAAADRMAPTLPVMESPATAPGVAWWDVPSGVEVDPRRGRFALGGYAIQSGHQVVSGVTFREGVVPPPSHWVIGPVVGEVAPGTLVLNVDGCLNCRPEDLAVLTDPGFAPTSEGFSLKLVAAETGPFAASGTFFIS